MLLKTNLICSYSLSFMHQSRGEKLRRSGHHLLELNDNSVGIEAHDEEVHCLLMSKKSTERTLKNELRGQTKL